MGVDEADASAHVGSAQALHGKAVREQLMVRGRQRVEQHGAAGRVGTERVAPGGDRGRLGKGDPGVNAVAESLPDCVGVVGETAGGVAVQPAAAQGRWQVPVREGSRRTDAVGQQRIQQPIVERESVAVEGATPIGLQPGPAQREPVGVDTEVAQQGGIRFVILDVVGRDGRVRAVADASGPLAEGIPDAVAAATVAGGSLDLKSGGGDGDLKPGRQTIAELAGAVFPVPGGDGAGGGGGTGRGIHQGAAFFGGLMRASASYKGCHVYGPTAAARRIPTVCYSLRAREVDFTALCP